MKHIVFLLLSLVSSMLLSMDNSIPSGITTGSFFLEALQYYAQRAAYEQQYQRTVYIEDIHLGLSETNAAIQELVITRRTGAKLTSELIQLLIARYPHVKKVIFSYMGLTFAQEESIAKQFPQAQWACSNDGALRSERRIKRDLLPLLSEF